MKYRLESGEVIEFRPARLTPEKIKTLPGTTAHDRIGLLCVVLRREIKALRVLVGGGRR